MTEQEYINACDLRSWRIVLSAVRWIGTNETTRKVAVIVNDEIARLESLVDQQMNDETREHGG